MTDHEINATIDRHRRNNPGAVPDLILFAHAIDEQRHTNNLLADQSQRLRQESEGRRKVLAKILTYAEATAAQARDQHCKFALGTVANMVRQVVGAEAAV